MLKVLVACVGVVGGEDVSVAGVGVDGCAFHRACGLWLVGDC